MEEMKWKWTEASDSEFEENGKNLTYYRIFHNEDRKRVTDYKFWSKNDETAYEKLSEFKEEHEGEFYFEKSGYFVSSDGNRYDSMDDMLNGAKKHKYDDEDRKYDKEYVLEFVNGCNDVRNNDMIENLLNMAKDIITSVDSFKSKRDSVLKEIGEVDMNIASEEEIDRIRDKCYKVNDIIYELKKKEHILRTKHGLTEAWNLDYHLIEDLKYNLKELIEHRNGYPNRFKDIASEKNRELENSGIPTKDIDEFANELWGEELKHLREHVLGVVYLGDYGIVDEDDDDMVEYGKRHKNVIPYVKGTLDTIDYEKAHNLLMTEWNYVWNWIRDHGMELWD